MPASRGRRDRRDRRDLSRHRSRSSSREGQSPGKRDKHDGNSGYSTLPAPQTREQLEHLVRRMLAVTLRKFESGSEHDQGEKRERERAHERSEDNKGEKRERERAHERSEDNKSEGIKPGDSDLAKLVLSQVLQFGIRRYLKSREKKRMQAAKSRTQSHPSVTRDTSFVPVPVPVPVQPPTPMSGSGTQPIASDRAMPPYPPQPPPPGADFSSHELREGEGRRQQWRLERERLERERLEKERRARRRGDSGQYGRYDSPSLPRRILREPIPRSSSLRESFRYSSGQEARENLKDFPDSVQHGRRPPRLVRDRDPLPSRPLRPSHPDVNQDSALPHPSSWEPVSVPLPVAHEPPLASQFKAPVDRAAGRPVERPADYPAEHSSNRPAERGSERRPVDPLTSPNSPLKPSLKPSVLQVDALDELAHAIDSLLADIRETDSLLYRAVYRPAAAENGRQWYERESLREQAGGLQRSLQRAAAEAWAMQEALRRRKMPNDDSDKDRVTIQKGKKRVTLVEPERE